ncbi:MAG: T9SS type A sorting domain-containing protein [Dysgonamonadaceae bacterium]|jgi:hypothetical protein|nr:T9SS type A sorting domain-containing protein [Dysgonamonadaceae bacterium]
MKKNYFLVFLAISFASLSWGQSIERYSGQRVGSVNKNGSINNQKTEDFATVATSIVVKESANIPVKSTTIGKLEDFRMSKIKKVTAADLETEYRRPYGSLVRTGLLGQKNDGKLYKYNSPILVIPARQTASFYPYASDKSAVFTWSIEETSTNLDEYTKDGVLNYIIGTPTADGYVAYIPNLKATANGKSATYKYGSEVEDGGAFLASPNNLNSHTLTNCDIHLGGGPYNEFESGEKFGPGYSKNGVSCNGILATYAPLGILSIRGIQVLATTSTGNNINKMIPTGKKLNLSIYYLTEDGSLEENPVATAEATPDDVNILDWVGFINFKFSEFDDEGFVTDRIIHLQDKQFVVIVNGFDSTFDIQFLFSTAHGWDGDAYTIHNDKLETFGYSNEPNTPLCTLFIAFDGIFNCFEADPEIQYLRIPNEGGYTVDDQQQESGVAVYTTLGNEDIEIVDSDEWIKKVWYDDSYFAEYSILYYILEGDPLPAGIKGRTGKVVLRSFDRTLTLWAIQGDATGIASAPSEHIQAVRQGDDFALTYPASATVLSVYNIAGQKIAEQPLKGNSAILPVDNWAKGVYMLKFNDEKSTTIKVLR